MQVSYELPFLNVLSGGILTATAMMASLMLKASLKMRRQRISTCSLASDTGFVGFVVTIIQWAPSSQKCDMQSFVSGHLLTVRLS